MKIKFASVGFLIASLFTIVLAVTGATVVAQSGGRVTDNGSTANSEQAGGDNLRISPLRSELSIKPGETGKVTVYLQNLTTQTVNFKAINNDFIAGSKEDGMPDIILDENEYAPIHSLKRFMQPIENMQLAPGERKAVDVVINVPQNAQAGGYFGAIRFAPALADGSSSVSVSGSVTSLILMTVPGNLVENLSVKQFGVQQNGKTATRFSNSKDIKALIRLENKGNVHVAPFGEVFVEKGKKVIYSAKINDTTPKGLILPDSVRKWEVPLKDIGSFGKYKVTAVVSYGGSNQTMTMEQTIWIIPAAFIIGAIVILLAIIVIVFLIVKSLKAYKQRILRGARRR